MTELKKRLINRVLDSELTTHLGYDKHERPEGKNGNSRNGHTEKAVRCDDGKLAIKVPREVEVSPALMSNATEAVCEEVAAWQNRCLDPVYPIVYFDAVVVKIRHEGKISNRAIYPAAEAVAAAGGREVYCLSWEFEMDLRLETAALEKELGVEFKLIPIPRETMEKNRTSPPPFLEMALLEAAPEVKAALDRPLPEGLQLFPRDLCQRRHELRQFHIHRRPLFPFAHQVLRR